MKFQGQTEKTEKKFKPGFVQQTISSILGSSVATIINTPLDVVKSRLQVQKAHIKTDDCFIIRKELIRYVCPDKTTVRFKEVHFNGVFDALLKIYKYEGFKGLYKNFLPTFAGTIPSTAVYYITYEEIRTAFKGGAYYDDAPVSIPVAVFAGTVAKTLGTIVSMAVQPLLYLVPGEHSVYNKKNKIKIPTLKSSFKPLPLQLCRDIPFSAIHWPIYEYLKIAFDAPDPTLMFSFCAGVFAASVAAFFTTPLDLILTLQDFENVLPVPLSKGTKKIKQIHVTNVVATLKEVYQMYGIAGCFAGVGPRLLKIAPSVGFSVALFEVGNSFFYQLNEKQYYTHNKREKKSSHTKKKKKPKKKEL